MGGQRGSLRCELDRTPVAGDGMRADLLDCFHTCERGKNKGKAADGEVNWLMTWAVIDTGNKLIVYLLTCLSPRTNTAGRVSWVEIMTETRRVARTSVACLSLFFFFFLQLNISWFLINNLS